MSERTSPDYLAYLCRRSVDYLIAGDDHVDLSDALAQLSERHGVETLRTDAGGSLNGALLAADLVDEIALILNKRFGSTDRVVAGPAATRSAPPQRHPVEIDRDRAAEDGAVWLRYELHK